MAKITFQGNVSKTKFSVENGQPLLAFDVAENHSYFDEEKKEWIETGTTWHRCAVWGAKADAWKDMVQVGAGLIVDGVQFTRTSDKLDANGNPFKNDGVRVKAIGFTPSRIKSIEFKEKSEAANANEENPEAEMAEQANNDFDQENPF